MGEVSLAEVLRVLDGQLLVQEGCLFGQLLLVLEKSAHQLGQRQLGVAELALVVKLDLRGRRLADLLAEDHEFELQLDSSGRRVPEKVDDTLKFFYLELNQTSSLILAFLIWRTSCTSGPGW